MVIPKSNYGGMNTNKANKSKNIQIGFRSNNNNNNDSNKSKKKSKQYTMSEVAQHNNAESAWIVIDKKIYDVTEFETHPGTHKLLLKVAGQDRTKQFKSITNGAGHPSSAYELMQDMYVGDVKE